MRGRIGDKDKAAHWLNKAQKSFGGLTALEAAATTSAGAALRSVLWHPVGERQALTTSPPKRYTEGTTLKSMKNIADVVEGPRLKAKLKAITGIGTQATRASIIQGLMQRGYLVCG